MRHGCLQDEEISVTQTGGNIVRVYHGDIVTVNSNDDVFQYLVENRGRIIYVGNDLPAKYSKAEVIELGTRALIPPFADTH